MCQFVMSIRLGMVVLFLSMIFVNGCTLSIRSPAPTTPSPDVGSAEIPITTHVVKQGETLESVALMYGIGNFQDLMVWNRLSSTYVSPGQTLIVSAPLGYVPLAYTGQVKYPVSPIPSTPIARFPTPVKKTVAPPVVCGSGDYHTVKKGETLHRIAKACGRSLAELATWNALSDPYPLSIGQSLRVRKPSTTSTFTASSTTGSSHYHVVRQGDTLYSVSRRYGQNLQDIARWNNLQPPYTLSPNQQVLIKPPSGSNSAQSTNNSVVSIAQESKPQYHSVSAGETLYSISKKYGQTVEAMAAQNGLSPPYNLNVGQNLHVFSSDRKTITSSKGRTVNVPGGYIQHIVKRGETAYSIANHYGITVFDLATWNGIGKPYTIYPSQKLKIMKGQ